MIENQPVMLTYCKSTSYDGVDKMWITNPKMGW